MNTAKLLQEYYETNNTKPLGLFFQYQIDFIYRIALSMTKNKADAEDIVQQVYMVVLEKKAICQAAKEANEQKVQAWLAVISMNESRVFLRRKKINKKAIQNKKSEQRDQTMKNKKDHISDIFECINQLPQKTRIAIHLHYREDLPFNEIADAMKIKQSSVRSLISRGLEKIRKTLVINGIILSSSAILNQLQAQPLEKAPQDLWNKCQLLNRASRRINPTTATSKSSLLPILTFSTISLIAISSLIYFQKKQTELPFQTNTQIAQMNDNIKIDEPLFHKKWVFDKSERFKEIVDLNQNSEYDENQKAIKLKNLRLDCLYDINTKYRRPTKLSFNGHFILKTNQFFDLKAAIVLKNENDIIKPLAKHIEQKNRIAIQYNQKQSFSQNIYLIGNYMFLSSANKNTYSIAKQPFNVLETSHLDMLVLLQCQYITDFEVKELDKNETIETVSRLKNVFNKRIDPQEFNTIFSELDLVAEKLP